MKVSLSTPPPVEFQRSYRYMSKSLTYFVSLLVILCAAELTLGQMRSDPTGTWAGPLATDAGPGGLEITLSRDSSGWQGKMKFRLEGQESAPPVRDLKVGKDDISFAFDLDRNLVKVVGRFRGDKLTGTVEAFQGERRIGGGTFTLSFGGQMPPLQPQ